MTDRKRVWGARLVLVFIPVALFVAGAPISLHTALWPVGRVRSFGEVLVYGCLP